MVLTYSAPCNHQVTDLNLGMILLHERTMEVTHCSKRKTAAKEELKY